MSNREWTLLAAAPLLVLSLVSCGKKDITDQDEIAQSTGDVMASADEMGGSSGAVSFYSSKATTVAHTLTDRLYQPWLEQSAYATSCYGNGFGACSSGTMTRTFGGCTVGGGTFTGTVAITFSNAASCSNTSPTLGVGESITRVPNFTITGLRGATLTVSGAGQVLTKTGAGAFSYRVNGISRVLKNSSGSTLFDISTTTTSDIAVTGTSRSNRVMNGGALVVKHNVKNYTTTLTPENLTWTSTCTCASSGKLTGKIEGDESADDVTIQITGCGTGTITANGKTSDVNFDRCAGS